MKIYNTLTRRKEDFTPLNPEEVRMYVCGPTTYNLIHIGNARPIVFFDTVRRYLDYKGYRVKYVQNFTDVDDKIIARAKEEGMEPLSLAEKYIAEYNKDAESLNVKPADAHPKVSEHIPEIINMIKTLIEKKAAYVVEGDVYFDLEAFPGYGKLSGRSPEEMQAGARVEVDERKKNPLDFALWKAAKPGEPAWDSPWGRGRPGWHIECSAMSLKYLGTNFDLHGGGFDLIFPHHENEIAQSEAATGEPFARFWMHNGFVTVNREKMSKSLGNFFLLRDVLKSFPPEVVRFFLLQTHYRSPLDFDDQGLKAAGRGLDRIRNSIKLLGEARDQAMEKSAPHDGSFTAKLEELRENFEAAMEDDFNTALAIGVLFDLVREVNTYLHEMDGGRSAGREAVDKALNLFVSINRILGIFTRDPAIGGVLPEKQVGQGELVDALLDILIGVRQEARGRKDWRTADKIRDGLKNLGIILEDTPQGVRVKKAI